MSVPVPTRLAAMLFALAGPTHAFAGLDAPREALGLELARAPAAAFAPILAAAPPGERARVVRSLGRVRDPAAVPPLTGLLTDPDPAVRAEAAFALGHLEGTAGPVLSALAVERDPAVYAAFLDALGRTGDAGVVSALLAGLRTDSAPAASVALGRLAIRGVPISDDPEVARALLDQLAPLAPARRRAAAFALARLRPGGLPDDLAARLAAAATGEPDAVARAWLVRASSALPDGHWASVRDAAGRDAAPGVRIALANALARRRSAAEAGVLAALLADEERSVRVAALEAARDQPWDPAWEDPLHAMIPLHDTEIQARALPLLALHAGLEEAESWLHPTVDPAIRAAMLATLARPPELSRYATTDPSAKVRSSAVERLLALEVGPEVLAPLLSADDPVVAGIAALGLAEARGADAAEAIERQFVDRNDYDGLLGLLQALDTALRDVAQPATGGPRGPIPLPGSLRQQVAIRVAELERHPDVALRGAARAVGRSLGLPDPGPAPIPPLPPEPALEALLGARVLTERGELTLTFDADLAPNTVWRWVQLAEAGTFDGVPFHRVVPDFVVQTGDPRGDGYGGPGASLPDELSAEPFGPWSLGMATGGPDTAGSQWFVTLSPQPHLTGEYTRFGEVVQGREVLLRLRQGDRVERVIIERREHPGEPR